jgi:hypothetical protein
MLEEGMRGVVDVVREAVARVCGNSLYLPEPTTMNLQLL